MFKWFANLEKSLGRAGLFFIGAVLTSMALALVLSEVGGSDSVALLVVWCAMPVVAVLMFQAARAKGRNPWLYGIGSLLPPVAIYLFFVLARSDGANGSGSRPSRNEA